MSGSGNHISPRGNVSVHNVDLELSHLVQQFGTQNFRCSLCDATLQSRRSGRVHVRNTHLSRNSLPSFGSTYEQNHIAAPADEPAIEPVVGDQQNHEQLHPELANKTASASEMLNLIKISGGISDRMMSNILDVLKMDFDFKSVKRSDVINSSEYKLLTTNILRCGDCDLPLDANIPDAHSECDPVTELDTFSRAELKEQFTTLFTSEKVSFWKPESYRKLNIISDCKDGSAYRELATKFNAEYPGCKMISCTLNADGVKLTNDNRSGWPIFLTINELESNIRGLPRNMIVYAIWISKKGEGLNVPLAAMLRELKKDLAALNEEGIDIVVNGVPERIRIVNGKAAADTPAKAKLLAMMCFNGFHACPMCEIPGHSVPSGNGHCHSYAREDMCTYKRRTHADMLRQAEEVQTSGLKVVTGMKGTPPLSLFPFFDVAKYVIIDDLHMAYLGIAKRINEQWFNGFDSLPCRLTASEVTAVRCCVANIRPPKEVPRVATKLKISNVKGCEARQWVHQYSIASTYKIVDDEYLEHYGWFVEGIGLLSQREISPTDLSLARVYLKQFCSKFCALYGEKSYGINVHYLEHLVEYVDLHGPLPENSLFPFESYNSILKRHCHSTHDMGLPLLRHLLQYQRIERTASEITDTRQKKLISKMKRKRSFPIAMGDRWKAYCVGTAAAQYPCAAGIDHITREFTRLEVDGVTVWTDQYKKPTKRCSKYLYCTTNNKALEIRKILCCTLCSAVNFLIIPLNTDVVSEKLKAVSNVFRVTGYGEETLFPLAHHKFLPAVRIVGKDDMVFLSVLRQNEIST